MYYVLIYPEWFKEELPKGVSVVDVCLTGAAVASNFNGLGEIKLKEDIVFYGANLTQVFDFTEAPLIITELVGDDKIRPVQRVEILALDDYHTASDQTTILMLPIKCNAELARQRLDDPKNQGALEHFLHFSAGNDGAYDVLGYSLNKCPEMSFLALKTKKLDVIGLQAQFDLERRKAGFTPARKQ